jgi:hypothetical protein
MPWCTKIVLVVLQISTQIAYLEQSLAKNWSINPVQEIKVFHRFPKSRLMTIDLFSLGIYRFVWFMDFPDSFRLGPKRISCHTIRYKKITTSEALIQQEHSKIHVILIIGFHKRFRFVNVQLVPCLDAPNLLWLFYRSQLKLIARSNFFSKELINQVQQIKVSPFS